jgi:hypothetical protein
MKLKILLWLAVVLSFSRTNGSGAVDPIQIQFELMARAYSHFSLNIIVKNQPLRFRPPMGADNTATNAFAAEQEQVRLVKELGTWTDDRDALAALLKHADPKGRTLALGALFLREDGRDLPLIASLINDPAPTFPNLHASMNSRPGPPAMSEVESPQTVGEVAQAMLAYCGVPHDDRQVGIGYGGLDKRTGITTNDFADYWKKYEGREYSASWFAVKMKRATRLTDPIPQEAQPDIERVLAQMKSLPMPDCVWTRLYVMAPGDNELLAATKNLGPATLMRFLQRQKISDDPDLLMDKNNGQFDQISRFILGNADQLLRPEDADALLACEKVERDGSGVNPAWFIGAALVQPARASEILRGALAETAQSQLAGTLWRIRGAAELDFLVNWLYSVLPTAIEPWHQPEEFLRTVQGAARPDTKQLLIALIQHPRFDYTDWTTLKGLLQIVNASRATPLVDERGIYGAEPGGGLPDKKTEMCRWRNLLRHE